MLKKNRYKTTQIEQQYTSNNTCRFYFDENNISLRHNWQSLVKSRENRKNSISLNNIFQIRPRRGLTDKNVMVTNLTIVIFNVYKRVPRANNATDSHRDHN